MAGAGAMAQKSNADIRKGNQLYKQKNYAASKDAYNKALAENPNDPTANYNLGNTAFRSEKHDEAVQLYDNTISNSKDKPVREKAFYNKGVALSKEKKLQESIDAWKESLKLDPNDNDARENLQKALLELKKQQQQQQQQNKDKKEDKKKDQQKQNKEQEQQQQQQQSKLDKQKVEQYLKSLEQAEKEIQKKMQKGTASPNKPDKDW
ncbi:MAG: tetratricopeptide repeat protein [Bacteroidetes bacterium]|nr:tetratricopeptide repeat protein [Bacteroidota bacterium]